MKQISIDEFERKLINNIDKNFLIYLSGIVNATIKILSAKIIIDDDNIKFINNNKEEISINKHQFMKIEEDEIYFYVKCDALLDIKIKKNY